MNKRTTNLVAHLIWPGFIKLLLGLFIMICSLISISLIGVAGYLFMGFISGGSIEVPTSVLKNLPFSFLDGFILIGGGVMSAFVAILFEMAGVAMVKSLVSLKKYMEEK